MIKNLRTMTVVGSVMMAPSSAIAATNDTQIWSTLNVSTKLSKHIILTGEFNARATEDVSHLGTTILRTWVGYQTSKRLTLSLGYTHNASSTSGKPTTLENNVFQQATWIIGKLGPVTVKSRTWVEERWFDTGKDTGVRARERIRFEVPLNSKGLTAVASDEQIFALNTTDWGAHAGFDQMRNFVGINIPVAKNITLETGYMNRYVKRFARPDRIDHILPLSLAIKL